LLGKAVAAKASDIHIKVGQPPGARVAGDMVYFRVDKVTASDAEAVARHVLRNPKPDELLALRERDTSYTVAGVGRFRVNIYRQRGSLVVFLRAMPTEIP